MSLPGFSVRRPVMVLMLFLAILLFGIVCFVQLGVDLMPEIEPPAISVVTAYPGATAEDVEEQVTKKLENQLSIVSGLDELTSRSTEGVSAITCKFAWGANLDEASNDIRDRLEFAKRFLPDEIEPPMIFKFNTSMFPVLVMGVTGNRSWEGLQDLVEDDVADPLKTVPGVGAVQVFGGLKRQINIHLDREAMKARGISLTEVQRALTQENVTLPGGKIEVATLDFGLRISGKFAKLDEIRQIVVHRNSVADVHLSDIAEVEDGFQEQLRTVSIDDNLGIILMVQKQSGVNTVEVAGRVHRRLAELKKRLPPDVRMQVLMDSSEFIQQSVDHLTRTVLFGGVFVGIITLLFLRRLIQSAIVMLAVPFSLIVAFIILFAFGFTLNTISLASLAIAIGMVVDNAIVILENITRHVDEGERVREASIFAASEVGQAVTASTLTTAIIFLPLVFVKGITGIIFQQLGLCVSATILASLLAALTLTPMLCSKLILSRRERQERGRKWWAAFHDVLERRFVAAEAAYQWLLTRALRHRLVVVFGALFLLMACLSLLPRVGSEFFPEEDTGEMRVTLQLPVGTRLAQGQKIGDRAARLFRKMFAEQTRHLYVRAGRSRRGHGGGMFKEGPHIAIVGAKLTRVIERPGLPVTEIAQQYKQALLRSPDIFPYVRKLFVSTGNPMGQMLMGGSAGALSLEVFGNDLEQTLGVAEKIRAIAEGVPGCEEPVVTLDIARPEFTAVPNRVKAGRLQVRMKTIAEAIQSYFYGDEVTRFLERGDEFEIFLRLKETDRLRLGDLRDVTVPNVRGQPIRLDSVADEQETLGPVEIERKDQQRVVRVEGRVYGRSLGEVTADIQAEIDEMALPQGVYTQWSGMVEEQQESFWWLRLALGLGVILVYMVMAAQFESLLNPFVIMFSIPFAFVGVVLALIVTGSPLSIMTYIGMILLIGVVVNNAIVLVDYTGILRARGLSLYQAARTAGRQRLRPVLMTALTTSCGLLPLALSRGEGAEAWSPFAFAVITGLLFATMVTLILVPVLYTIAQQYLARQTWRTDEVES